MNKYVKYRCTKCQAEDNVGFFDHEAIFQAINCWSCHAGYGTEMGQMLVNKIGMFPVKK